MAPERPLERLETVIWRDTLWRAHLTSHSAAHFGRSGRSRFDAPDESFGVLYLGGSWEAAFLERNVRASDPAHALIVRAMVEGQRMTAFQPLRPLRLAKLHGSGLLRAGHDAALTASRDYGPAQALSKAVHDGRADVDGLCWRSRVDNDLLNVALYERAGGALGPPQEPEPIYGTDRFWRAIDRYALPSDEGLP